MYFIQYDIDFIQYKNANKAYGSFLLFNDLQNREDQANYVYFVQAYVVSSFGRNYDNLL